MTAGTRVLPTSKAVKELLSGLVGRPVAVAPGAPVTPTERSPASVAVYVDPDMRVNALCVMDLALSAWTAGALALLPPGGVRDAVEEDGELTAMLTEALHEVVNVVSALFNVPGAPHSKLHRLVAPGDDVDDDIAGMLAAVNRVDLAVEVSGYGKGSLSLVIP